MQDLCQVQQSKLLKCIYSNTHRKTLFPSIFTDPFVARTSGYSRCVRFFGTCTRSTPIVDILCFTVPIDCALKASQVRRAFWIGKSNADLAFST